MEKYKCPCCGYYTMSEEPPGTWEICPVCFWEDDFVQYGDPEYEGGANHVSLKVARDNYLKIGACSPEFIANVRKPLQSEISEDG